MQAVVRGRQGEGKVGCLMPAEGEGGRWTGRRGSMERGGVLPREGEGGQEGGGQWGGGISVMECLGGHTFPEQRRVTGRLVVVRGATGRGQGWLTDVV